MKKHLLLLLLPLLVGGCKNENEISQDENSRTKMEIVGEYVIPINDAINDLQAFLDAIEPKTRTEKEKKVIKRVETVMNGDIATRSGGSNLAPIAYIVEFENDGYAVVGADMRAPGVMAIVEEGKLDPIHFTYKELLVSPPIINDTDTEDYEEYEGIEGIEDELADEREGGDFDFVREIEFPYLLGSFVNAYLQEQIAEAEDNPETRATWTWNGKTWEYLERVEIMARSVWHQDSPFSDNVSSMKGKEVVAGCVSIALAQICNYHQFPKAWQGITLPWTRIRKVHSYYNGSTMTPGSSYDQEWASYLVAVCGTQAKTKYGTSSSSAKNKNAAKALQNMGYKGVKIRRASGINEYVAESIRCNCPVYYRGERSTGFLSWSGHAWVCDGLWRLQSGSEYMCLLHCNFGWGGTHNGWYRTGMFNTSQNMVSYATWVGDSYNPSLESAGRNYKTRQKAITYNKP